MLDIGWQELLLIGIIALLVVGPQEMPRLMLRVTKLMKWVRAQMSVVQAGMDDLAKEAELEDIRKIQQQIAAGKSPSIAVEGLIAPIFDPREDLMQAKDDIRRHFDTDDVRQGVSNKIGGATDTAINTDTDDVVDDDEGDAGEEGGDRDDRHALDEGRGDDRDSDSNDSASVDHRA